ncbi:hypothetical protein AQF52_8070 [Streptomyces venezuelae]|uniref:CHAT domain-containing protein n=1 Tax=Streptomyces gardneri TaxID=66892 RepID=UPI0006BC9E03|nr:CHAT domain-containing protein [Streptomyces gardneri]ALO05639.1 hypothetical protein AQF52_0037 [Streptomyces venezuelae]ALO13651.1 hypothetical protein AQF52_8070 [Streptomyces venezuelae]QPK43236.1 CHAT domain-containing protein [Streptomyces gardneri]QPK50227.1 CHAT domain-containing protein [Streptomyces gardneri]WRK34446.1 CHAT domain-containing protein [Streptomyces venezuelae]
MSTRSSTSPPLLFNLAAVHGHAAALAAELYPTIYRHFLREVAAGSSTRAIDVAIDMLRWQERRGHAQDAAGVAQTMAQLLKADPPSIPSAGRAAGMLAALDPHLTGLDRADLTAWALEHIDLDHNDRFAMRVTLARTSGPGWAQRSFAELRGAFEEVVEQIRDSFAEHVRPRIFGQLLGGTRDVAFDLMRSGDHRLLWQWLGLCRGVDHGAVRDDPCLAIGWGGDRVWFRPDQPLSPATGRVTELLHVLNGTLGSGVVAVGQVNTALTVPVSGRKNVAAAAQFEEVLEEFVDTADLARHARDSGAASIVSVLPGQVPVQALLARAGGPVLPYSVSALPPAADRTVRRVQLWVDNGLELAVAEAQILRRLLEDCWIEVEEVSGDAVTREAFLAAYAGDEFDVIWVISHAGDHPYRHDESALQLRAGHEVTADDLLTRPAPAGDRRLLVLNACSTATGGPGLFSNQGLVRNAAGPHQAVIGQLWQVDIAAAAVFGALLAIELVQFAPFSEAFQNALIMLQQPRQTIIEHLRDFQVWEIAADALDRFESATLLDTGSPALFE